MARAWGKAARRAASHIERAAVRASNVGALHTVNRGERGRAHGPGTAALAVVGRVRPQRKASIGAIGDPQLVVPAFKEHILGHAPQPRRQRAQVGISGIEDARADVIALCAVGNHAARVHTAADADAALRADPWHVPGGMEGKASSQVVIVTQVGDRVGIGVIRIQGAGIAAARGGRTARDVADVLPSVAQQ